MNLPPLKLLPLSILVVTLLLLAGPSLGQSGDRGLYLTAKLGSTDVEADIEDIFDQVIDGDEDSTTFEVGYKLNRFFGVQAGYHDLGDFASVSTCPECEILTVPLRAETTAYSLSVVPQTRVFWRLSVFGKIGMAFLDTDLRTDLGAQSEPIDSFSDEEVIYGAGARFRIFSNLSVLAEWEQIGSDIETVSIGATLQF